MKPYKNGIFHLGRDSSVFWPQFYDESHTTRPVKVVATLLIVGGAAALAFGQ